MRARDYWVEVEVEHNEREEHFLLAEGRSAAVRKALAMPGIEVVVCVRRQPVLGVGRLQQPTGGPA